MLFYICEQFIVRHCNMTDTRIRYYSQVMSLTVYDLRAKRICVVAWICKPGGLKTGENAGRCAESR